MRPPVRRLAALAFVMQAAAGCHAVRDLEKDERDYLKALRAQVQKNGESVKRAIADIGRIHENAAAVEHERTLNAIAKAKLLESLRSPWTAPPSSMQSTQRAVVLFHLYELASAEQRAFDAEQAARAERRAQILRSWNRLGELLDEAIGNQERILRDLNQPVDEQAEAALAGFLTEARAFQAELAKSEDAWVKTIAGRSARAIDRLDDVKDKVRQALQLVHALDAINLGAPATPSGGAPPNGNAGAKPAAGGPALTPPRR